MKRPILEDALHVLLVLGICLFFLSGCGVVPEGSSETENAAPAAPFEYAGLWDSSSNLGGCISQAPMVINGVTTLGGTFQMISPNEIHLLVVDVSQETFTLEANGDLIAPNGYTWKIQRVDETHFDLTYVAGCTGRFTKRAVN